MENTNTIQFQDDQAQFFLPSGESYRGPFKASELYSMLQSKEISWIDFCYREQEGSWMRIADHPVFKSLQPEPPKPKPQPQPKTAAPPPPPKAEPETKWFLYQKQAQTGPYGSAELQRLVHAGQIEGNAFVWQEKFTEWKPYRDVPELNSQASGAATAASAQPSDRRTAPRKPLVAQIYLTNQKEILTGLCRDISVGGMQVLTEKVPGQVGESIQLNVCPPDTSGMKPFVAEGVIVRVLEDQRGFSFRFTKISDDSKAAIERYIS